MVEPAEKVAQVKLEVDVSLTEFVRVNGVRHYLASFALPSSDPNTQAECRNESVLSVDESSRGEQVAKSGLSKRVCCASLKLQAPLRAEFDARIALALLCQRRCANHCRGQHQRKTF